MVQPSPLKVLLSVVAVSALLRGCEAFLSAAKNSDPNCSGVSARSRIPSPFASQQQHPTATTLYYTTQDDQPDEELLHRALLAARLGVSGLLGGADDTDATNSCFDDTTAMPRKKEKEWAIHRALLEARLQRDRQSTQKVQNERNIHRALLEARLSNAAAVMSIQDSPSNDQPIIVVEEDDTSMWLGGDVPPLSSAVDDTSTDAILDALNARREQLQVESAARRERWVTAKCQSAVRLMMDDWVRRLDLKRWPIVALGTAKGGVVVADLDRGEVIARSPDNTHSPIGGNPNLNEFLYSTHDGGGTTAVVIKGDSVISSGREGGARAWRLDVESKELVDLGALAKLKGKQVSAMSVDAEGRLWVGVYDGTFEGSVYRYDLLDPAPLSDQEPHIVKLPSGVLSMAVSDETSLVACGTTGGTVELISMDKAEQIDSWKVNAEGTKADTHIRSVEIFQAGKAADEEEGSNENWCVVAGGGNGSMRMRWLQTDGDTASVNAEEPFDNARLPLAIPPHSGMVVSLTGCRQNGLLVSGSQDGTLRVYDFCYDDAANEDESDVSNAGSDEVEFSSEFEAMQDEPPQVDIHPVILYQLAGYKIWLSSICVDEKGLRLVTDGADNTVVVHDFTGPVEPDSGEQ
mmetsp:Transcript_22696/g.65390  ORF Transcript_22696/g.65390 Transcript_22696/m.65390 type:complete len:633 (+) Transcript_22696:91-1989(+)